MLQTLKRVRKALIRVVIQNVARKRKVIKFNWEIHVYTTIADGNLYERQTKQLIKDLFGNISVFSQEELNNSSLHIKHSNNP